MSKASDLLGRAVCWFPDRYQCYPGYKSKYGPGQWVENQPEHVRELLRELKSEDLANIRPDRAVMLSFVESARLHRKQEDSELKLAFDKLLKDA